MFVLLLALLLLCVTVANWLISRFVKSLAFDATILEGGFFVLTLLWILEELSSQLPDLTSLLTTLVFACEFNGCFFTCCPYSYFSSEIHFFVPGERRLVGNVARCPGNFEKLNFDFGPHFSAAQVELDQPLFLGLLIPLYVYLLFTTSNCTMALSTKSDCTMALLSPSLQ